MIEFKHRIMDFNPIGLLNRMGVNSITYPFRYRFFVGEAAIIIETRVRLSAVFLNKLLQTEFEKDMYLIAEYAKFTRYMSTLKLALSNPKHVGVYWDKKNNVQARFVNTDLLGDLNDLSEIQKMVHPGGTLAHWISIYNAWLAGRNNLYATIINKRLDIMESQSMAPFWELIDDGNDRYNAWPKHRAQHTLKSFRFVYNREMLTAYFECMRLIELIIFAGRGFRTLTASTVEKDNVVYPGYEWTSRSGRKIFVISGSEKLVGGKYVGKGFFLSPKGLILKRWSGWLPR